MGCSASVPRHAQAMMTMLATSTQPAAASSPSSVEPTAAATTEATVLIAEEEVERRSVDDEQSGAFAGVRMLAKVAAQPAPVSTEDADDGDAAAEATAPAATATAAAVAGAPLMVNAFTADLSQAREYLDIADGKKITPTEIRLLLSKLLPDAIKNHWHAVVGGRKRAMEKGIEPIINEWLAGGGTAAEHAALMNKRRVRGVVVHTDSSGLSKLSQRRPLLEVLRLIHEPKELIARYGQAVGAIPLPMNYVADNTGALFPVPSAAAAAAATDVALDLNLSMVHNGNSNNENEGAADLEDFSGDLVDTAAARDKKRERNFLETVIRTMMVVQHEIGRTCQVQVGMGLHFGTFFHIGDTLQGHEAEHVEHLAEDFCAAHEIAMTEETAREFFCNTDAGAAASATAACGLFSVKKRDDDEMNGYRVDFNESALTSSSESGNDTATAARRDMFMKWRVLPESVDARIRAMPGGYASHTPYPSGFSDEFFRFICKHSADEIVERQQDVESMIEHGIFLLVKVRGVEHDLLLDQIAQRIYVREEVQIAAEKTNRELAAASYQQQQQQGRIRVIKCNGDIAILLATGVAASSSSASSSVGSIAAAVRFSFNICARFHDLGSFGCSVGGWQGQAYIFDLSTTEKNLGPQHQRYYDVAGAPVNLASKLAEDFGEDGVFFGSDIFFSDPQQGVHGSGDESCERKLSLSDDGTSVAGVEDATAEEIAAAKQQAADHDEHDGEKKHFNKYRLSSNANSGSSSSSSNTKVFAAPVKIVKSGVTIHALKLRPEI